MARTCGACAAARSGDEGGDAIRAFVRTEPLGDDDAQAELAGAVEAVVGRDHLRIGVRLGHRDDAEALRLGHCQAQASETLRGGRLWQQVVDQVGGTLAQGADRRPRCIALDAPAFGVGSRGGDAGELEGLRVHPARVPVGGGEKRRAVGQDGVEVAPVGDAAGEEGEIPAAADQPGSVAEPGDAGAQASQDLVAVLAGVEVALGELDTPRERVRMTVVEAGENEATAELHHAGLRADEAGDLAVGADEDDPVAGDGDRLGPAASGIHGVDLTVPEDEVGRKAGPAAA